MIVYLGILEMKIFFLVVEVEYVSSIEAHTQKNIIFAYAFAMFLYGYKCIMICQHSIKLN